MRSEIDWSFDGEAGSDDAFGSDYASSSDDWLRCPDNATRDDEQPTRINDTRVVNDADPELVRPGEQYAQAGGSSSNKLKRIHPDSTYESDASARRSLEYWNRQSTEDIVKSLRPGPGQDEALRVKPDGTIMNSNTRSKVLQERGYNIDALPRELHSPRGGSGPLIGGGGSPGSGGRSGGGFFRFLVPWL